MGIQAILDDITEKEDGENRIKQRGGQDITQNFKQKGQKITQKEGTVREKTKEEEIQEHSWLVCLGYSINLVHGQQRQGVGLPTWYQEISSWGNMVITNTACAQAADDAMLIALLHIGPLKARREKTVRPVRWLWDSHPYEVNCQHSMLE